MEKQNNGKLSFFREKWHYCVLALLIAVLLITPAVDVLGKYITRHLAEGDIEAALFVANGDYMVEIQSGGSAPEKIGVSGWKDGIILTLYNYKNDDVSEVDLTYTVTLPSGWTLKDGKNPTEADGKVTVSGGSALGKGQKNSAVLHLIPPDSAKQLDEISFELKTAPYEIKMQATFVLTDSRVPECSIEDKGAYALLKIHTNDYEGKITVKYNSNIFAPDTTNSVMQSWERGNKENDSGEIASAERFTTYELCLFEELIEYSYTVGDVTADSDGNMIVTVTAIPTAS